MNYLPTIQDEHYSTRPKLHTQCLSRTTMVISCNGCNRPSNHPPRHLHRPRPLQPPPAMARPAWIGSSRACPLSTASGHQPGARSNKASWRPDVQPTTKANHLVWSRRRGLVGRAVGRLLHPHGLDDRGTPGTCIEKRGRGAFDGCIGKVGGGLHMAVWWVVQGVLCPACVHSCLAACAQRTCRCNDA